MSNKKQTDGVRLRVDRSVFDYDLGIKVAKAKYGEYEKFIKGNYISKDLEAIIEKQWDSLSPITVQEALSIPNLENRRICFKYIGIDKIFSELDPELVDEQTVKKSTRVTEKGELVQFNDTYKLYKVKGAKVLSEEENSRRRITDFYILSCKCTSTDRDYLIYIQNIWNGKKEDAIEAVAWTIQVDVPEKDIDYIVRAGDCIMVKTKKDFKTCARRHLTKREYLEKLTMES